MILFTENLHLKVKLSMLFKINTNILFQFNSRQFVDVLNPFIGWHQNLSKNTILFL